MLSRVGKHGILVQLSFAAYIAFLGNATATDGVEPKASEITGGPVSQNISESPESSINVSSVYKRRTSDGKDIFDISYSYHFKGLERVFIKGLGIAPPSGTFNYMTPYSRLEFEDADTHKTIAQVDLKPTVETMGSSTIDFPNDQFSPQFRIGIWPANKDFVKISLDVVQRRFPLGVLATQLDKQTYWTTRYINLDVPDVQLVSQIAIKLSQPYVTADGETAFHVQYSVRDRPRMSAKFRFLDECSPLTLKAANNFLNSFVEELKDERR